jgi:hypothetical protein
MTKTQNPNPKSRSPLTAHRLPQSTKAVGGERSAVGGFGIWSLLPGRLSRKLLVLLLQ